MRLCVVGAAGLLAAPVVGDVLPDPAPSPPVATERAAGPGVPVPDGIEITYDERQKITWYKPRMDLWGSFDFRILPVLGSADGGLRKIGIDIIVKNPPKGRPTSMQVKTEADPWVIPISESEKVVTTDLGCRVAQSIFLQNQASLAQMLARVKQAEVALMGEGRPVRYKLTEDDLENFRRIAALWEAETLPQRPERQPIPEPNYAGMNDVTLPRIIARSKVTPRFPQRAEGRKILGRVVLQAVVRKDGTIGELEVLKPAGGDCGFEEAAIEAIRKWRYKPATKGGEPVDVYFTIVVDFTYGSYKMAPG